jgi:hypothetical protein
MLHRCSEENGLGSVPRFMLENPHTPMLVILHVGRISRDTEIVELNAQNPESESWTTIIEPR